MADRLFKVQWQVLDQQFLQLAPNMLMVCMAKTFWSHLTTAHSSSHNSNEAWFCLLCSVRAVFVAPFQIVCYFRLGVTPRPISAILKLK